MTAAMNFGRGKKKKELTCGECGARAANKHVLACERCGGPIREMNAAAVKAERQRETVLKPEQQALVERLVVIPGIQRKRAAGAVTQLTTDRPEGDGVAVERMVGLIDELADVHSKSPLNDPCAYLFSLARGSVRPNLQYTSEPRSPRNGSQRLCCDLCGLPFWINELIVRGGLASCSACAGPKMRDNGRVVAAPCSEEQEAWDQQRAAVELEYEAAMEAACPPGTYREVAQRMIELSRQNDGASDDPLARKDRERDVLRRAVEEIAPLILVARRGRKQRVRELGLRPLGAADSMVAVEVEEAEPGLARTPAARRVEAHWANVNGG